MALIRAQLRLYLISDPVMCAERGVVDTVQEAVAGGVTMVQLRDKTATTATRIELARALMRALDGTGVPLVVNDDLEAAIAAGADGAHIGQTDAPPERARALLGPDKILGLSCETLTATREARDAPVDYLGLGPIFSTGTKDDHKPPIGWTGLAQMATAATVPTVAIGGIKSRHMKQVFDAGADGASVVSAICAAPDPRAAAVTFLKELSE